MTVSPEAPRDAGVGDVARTLAREVAFACCDEILLVDGFRAWVIFINLRVGVDWE
jgi:hypothetical protein